MKTKLLERYPLNDIGFEPAVDSKALEKLWDRFKACQTFIRNVGHPYYKTNYLDKYSSGRTTDVEVLQGIWESSRKEMINANARKHKSNFVNAEKSTLAKERGWTSEMERQVMLQWDKQHAPTFLAKKERWLNDPIPTGLVAFVMVGKPGLDSISVDVGGSLHNWTILLKTG